MWSYIGEIAFAPVAGLFTFGDPFSVYALLGAMLTALAWYVARRRRTLAGRVRAFARVTFSRRLWWHRSTRLDLKLFFVSNFANAAGIVSVFAVSYAASGATQWLLGPIVAPAAPALEPSALIAFAMALAYWIVFDLGYWLAHWLMHRVPVLWEFHKVHHSAEVLTPLTEWRQHPIELLVFPLCTGTTVGVLYGLAEHLLGMQRQGLSLFWINMLLLLYSATLLHLRHSQVWIPVRGWLGYLIQSPAHHQIHHSTDPKHFNKNLGYGLSLWDWAFRTLYIPQQRERLQFGLGPESREHDGVLSVLWLPFVKSARLMRSAKASSADHPDRPADHSAAAARAGS